ncbi:hypothetical protein Q7P35_002231 [Cladosporium inversicolor]
MWSILWFLPISSQRAPTREPERREVHESCRDFCFANLPLEDGLVDVAFEEDALWFKDGGGHNEVDGIAIVKVGLRVQQPRKGLLSTVECETTFSQPTQGFRSVHSSWPRDPGTDSCAQQENRGSNPCSHVEHVAYEQCPELYQFDCNTPAFTSTRLLSPGRTSGRYDLVKHALFTEHEPYRIIRKHCGAFVLCCANDFLIVTTLLRVFEKRARACADLGTFEKRIGEIKTSTQIEMLLRDPSVALHAPCGDMERWVDAMNRRNNNRTISLTATATSTRSTGSPEPELHSGLSRSSNGSLCSSAEWFKRLQSEVHSVLVPNINVCSGIKVATIDTGAHFSKSQYRGLHRKHISDCITWCDAKFPLKFQSFMDEEGNTNSPVYDSHGTHSLSVLRKAAPNCTIFVAQVFRDRESIVGRLPNLDQAQKIADAIDYAVKIEQVDIITLSFGFKSEVPIIRRAIDQAAIRDPKPCLIFAAASNFGGNEDVQWPASHEKVICVHAADGLGNKYHRNVTPEQPSKEFATLGCDVEAFTGPGQLGIASGTSVASPVAAGIAALILGDEIAQTRKGFTTRGSID